MISGKTVILILLGIVTVWLIWFHVFEGSDADSNSDVRPNATLSNLDSSESDSSLVTVVTAYFDLPGSKHSKEEYQEWARNFLSNVPCHLFIITDGANVHWLRELRKPFESRTHFVVKNFSDLESYKRWDVWKEQQLLDKERAHSPELYTIWHEKNYFVLDAIRKNPFESNYFIWCDLGSFRDPKRMSKIRSFGNPAAVNAVISRKPHTMLLLEVGSFVHPDDFELDDVGLPKTDFSTVNRLGGGILAGDKTAWIKWVDVYEGLHTRLRLSGRFVGKDQNTMAAVAVVYPELVQLVQPPREYYGLENEWWFYMQEVLS